MKTPKDGANNATRSLVQVANTQGHGNLFTRWLLPRIKV